MFREYAKQADICIAREYSVRSNDDDAEYDKLLNRMLEIPKARVLVCFCEGETVHSIFKAIRRFNRTGHFLLIGRLESSIVFLLFNKIIFKMHISIKQFVALKE